MHIGTPLPASVRRQSRTTGHHPPGDEQFGIGILVSQHESKRWEKRRCPYIGKHFTFLAIVMTVLY
jgi:hypothetical protein